MNRCAPWLWVLGLAALPGALAAQDRSFHGLYLGVEAAREDFIGGSFVNGTDFLAQETRTVVSLVAGARYQTSIGIVVGAEGTRGWTDGDLALEDPANDLSIEYANGSQTSLGGMVGYATGASKSVLIFAWASEVTRNFDVRAVQSGTSFIQEDEQGMLRYGLGIEVAAVRYLRLRFKIGKGRADFGDAITNITPENPLQVGLLVALQL